MNAEAQRIAIAEACGWKVIGTKMHIFGNPDDELCKSTCAFGDSYGNRNDEIDWIPDYLDDLNAMHEGVRSQDAQFQKEFALSMSAKAGAIHQHVHQLTAQDWADCFIFVLQSKQNSLKINA